MVLGLGSISSGGGDALDRPMGWTFTVGGHLRHCQPLRQVVCTGPSMTLHIRCRRGGATQKYLVVIGHELCAVWSTKLAGKDAAKSNI